MIRFDALKAVAMDVDGVLTDGGFWWGANGEELKRFCFADSTGIAQALQAGIPIALISGDSTPLGMALVKRYADRLKITDIYTGCHDKAGALREFAVRHGLNVTQVCYVGDDTIDLPAMALAGLAVAPLNAVPAVRDRAGYVTRNAGGNGAVREVIDLILQAATQQR